MQHTPSLSPALTFPPPPLSMCASIIVYQDTKTSSDLIKDCKYIVLKDIQARDMLSNCP